MSPEGPVTRTSSLQAAALYLLPSLTPCHYREVFLSLLNHGHLCFNGSVSQISLQIRPLKKRGGESLFSIDFVKQWLCAVLLFQYY